MDGPLSACRRAGQGPKGRAMKDHERGESAHAAAFSDLAAARAWYRDWLLGAAYPLWWSAGADHAGGGFLEALTDDGRPALTNAPRRARVQARQAYVFSQGGDLGWSGPWRQAARHGLDHLLANYTRAPGVVAKAVTPKGEPLDESIMLYEQAFAALALAAVGRIEPGAADLADQAALFRTALEARLHRGGYLEGGEEPFQANAQMHLLEASLACEETFGAEWRAMSDAIVELAMTRFIDPQRGFLREFFDEAWSVAGGDAGRLVEPGHQFEWAWLLERWGRLRDDARARQAARRLYAAGVAGIDPVRNVAVNALWDDLSLRDGAARLWPQTERFRAALIFGDEGDALKAAQGLARYLETPARGSWRDKLQPDGSFIDEPAPATSFYHILGACLELFRSGTA
jgi:mannose-1-phosphate guanylyltransferase/mannose-6-phosphate isomerase